MLLSIMGLKSKLSINPYLFHLSITRETSIMLQKTFRSYIYFIAVVFSISIHFHQRSLWIIWNACLPNSFRILNIVYRGGSIGQPDNTWRERVPGGPGGINKMSEYMSPPPPPKITRQERVKWLLWTISLLITKFLIIWFDYNIPMVICEHEKKSRSSQEKKLE